MSELEQKVAELLADRKMDSRRLDQMESNLAEFQKWMRKLSENIVELSTMRRVVDRVDEQVHGMQDVLAKAARTTEDIHRHGGHIEKLFERYDSLKADLNASTAALTAKIDEAINAPAKQALERQTNIEKWVMRVLVLGFMAYLMKWGD